ncbi:hypothetical protein CPB86DRAFT_782489 [Serendipita vermifera]|nr:hypothetical protein CPB86DRAFT_782489 [Serendipita vermifera]
MQSGHYKLHPIVDYNINDQQVEQRLAQLVQQIPWCISYELARIIQSSRSNDGFVDQLFQGFLNIDFSDMQSSASGMQKLKEFVKSIPNPSGRQPDEVVTAQERRIKEPWAEIDEENACQIERPDECLRSARYGRVHFRAHFNEKDSQIVLDSPMLVASCRFARKNGSESMIRIKLPEKFDAQKIVLFFLGTEFTLMGRSFRMCAVKDQTVILLWTPEAAQSLIRFWNWHNPLTANMDQTVGKWASRFDLGFSATVPSEVLEPERIFLRGDFDGRDLAVEKLPNNICMTDGCGYANLALLRRIRESLDLPTVPCAVQFRLGGDKGVLLLRPNDENYTEGLLDLPTVWIRPSQRKILGQKGNANQRRLEVVRTTYLRTPHRINADLIINLAYNGVPPEVFSNLNQRNMEEIFDSLTTWTGDRAMPKLCRYIERKGGVLPIRLNRLPPDPTALRSSYRNHESNTDLDGEWGGGDDQDDDGPTGGEEGPLDYFPNLVSGQPATLHETAVRLIQSGFTPENCSYLADLIKQMLKKQLEECVMGKQLKVPMSAYVLIAPVPETFKDLLGENEVHFLSSSANLQQPMGGSSHTLTGDALIARYPCKVPSDCQRVKVVNQPELSQYVDILLMPIQGKRSLASMLSGGDYDGDAVVVIWQPEILDNWKDPDPSFAERPDGFENLLKKEEHKISSILSKFPGYKSDQQEKEALVMEIQGSIVAGLKMKQYIGLYSDWHDKAVAFHGYSHPKTIELAYLQYVAIDASKSGETIRDSVIKGHKKTWGGRKYPQWRFPTDLNPEEYCAVLEMDLMRAEAAIKRKKLLDQYDALTNEFIPDMELCRPWEEEEENVRSLCERDTELGRRKQTELNQIKAFVERSYRNIKTCDKDFSKLPGNQRQKQLRTESMDFKDGPRNLNFYHPVALAHLKASYLYLLDARKRETRPIQWQPEWKWEHWSRRPWNVAMEDLCAIKAAASPEGRVSSTFYMDQFMQIGSIS